MAEPIESVHAITETFKAPDVAVEMMALGLIIMAAHLGGKLCRRLRLSEFTGQLVGGALVGPYALQLLGILPQEMGGLYEDALHAFHFFVFVFLSMVAFGIGEELHLSRLRKVGRSAALICLIQTFLTWFLISFAFYYAGSMSLVDSLLIGSIGVATAPAITFVLMNQLRIEGRLRQMLGSVMVLDNIVEVVLFSFLLQISFRQIQSSGGTSIWIPVGLEMLWALLLGGGIYFLLRILVRRHALSLLEAHEEQIPLREEAFLQRILAEHPSPSVEILLIVMGTVSIGAGLAYFNHWPFLITATFAGFLVANFHSQAIFDSLKIDNIAPMLNLAFFALIGASISLSDLTGPTLELAGLYILTRMIGKVAGTWIGCKLVHEEPKITSCMPRLMLPQAGVAAVEAVYAGAVLGKPQITAIILPAIVFFEIVGVFLVDRGLMKWRSWVVDEEKELKKKSAQQGPGEAACRLLLHLSTQNILLELMGKTKKEVIEELVDHARSISDQHIERAQALQVLGEREKLAATGFGNGIAIPHCRLIGIEKSVLVFGRHPARIEFGGVDNLPCDLFLLMLTPARDPGEHLRLLSSVAHILGDGNIRMQLRSAESPEAIIRVLQGAANKSE